MAGNHTSSDVPFAANSAGLGFKLLISALLFALLREGMAPLLDMSVLTEMSRRAPFFTALGCFLALDAFRFPWWVSCAAKLFAAVLAAGCFFYPSTFPGFSWWGPFLRNAGNDVRAVMLADWANAGPEVRTLLFLAGWAMLAGVLYRMLLHTRQVFWLAAALLCFLFGLQLYPGIETSSGIERTLALGLLAAWLLRAAGSRRRSPSGFRRALPAGIALAVWAASLGAGYWGARKHPGAAPVLDWGVFDAGLEAFMSQRLDGGMAAWPGDGKGKTNRAASTGYGGEDTELGAPLKTNDRIVFTAETEAPAYWRGESKNVYTGRGWLQQPVPTAGDSASITADAGGETESGRTIRQKVQFAPGFHPDVLFAAGTIRRVESVAAADGKEFARPLLLNDPESGRTAVFSSSDPPASYIVEADLPLKGAEAEAAETTGGGGPEEAAPVYLQLPEGLPGRVKELARLIGESAGKNAYAKAEAVERFLDGGSYAYSLSAPRPTPAGGDFVDEFLFSQKAGYCEHFSTAMVVLLRAMGVPARWVKGFAPGEIAGGGQQPAPQAGAAADAADAGGAHGSKGTYSVTVRSRDAHAWVEVFLPHAGWVPFDPTPGFAGSAAPGGPAPQAAAAPSAAPRATGAADAARLALGALAAAAACAAAIAALARVRGRLAPGPQPRPRRGKAEALALERLWRVLFRRYGRKPAHQTYREYACSLPVAKQEQREALLELVTLHETAHYSGRPFPVKEAKELSLLRKRLKS